ncbi:hypothetical protein ANCCAN_19542 [Ancylostoma caninum]|uniref:Uncharacterized protein n=1 Tax=Ancylostoma caninum TaxID=29170 RepID=A0A368FUX1_ANCCA|nr:hypothetical protein ANCCAN_19542 [Ancylostoma caninum]
MALFHRAQHFLKFSCSQKLAWWDVLTAPICLLWFIALCYLFCITVVRHFLIKKGTAKSPFLYWGEKEKSTELNFDININGPENRSK